MHRMMYGNLATVLCAVVLVMGLAACGGSSNTATTPDPPTEVETALTEAQTAAMTASGKAKTASDNAGTAADEAEAALADLMSVHVAKGEKTARAYAEEARTAANMAKAEYDKAKMESDKAAATNDVNVAAKAKLLAEAAQAKAEAQAATAAEKAKMAKDAATKEVRHVEGMTYGYGDTTITAGAPKVETTTGGKTVTTGKGGGLTDNSRTTQRKEPVPYKAATDSTPEVAGQTGFHPRTLEFGSYSDSEKSRLWLVTKYVTKSKAVKSYRRAKDASDQPITVTATITAENPFGGVTVDSQTYKVMRAEGEFYVVDTQEDTKFDKTNSWDWINADAPDANAGVGVYYYTDSNGKKTWLLRTGNEGVTGFTYRQIFVYDVPDFPEAKPYEHMNYGMWHTEKVLSKRDHLGIAFVRALPGKGPTPTANMPSSGSATYRGQAVWQKRVQHAEGKGSIAAQNGNSTTTVDFGKSTIKTDIFWDILEYPTQGGVDGILATFHGTIDGNGFSGSKVTNVNAEGDGYNTPGLPAASAPDHRNAVKLATSADGSKYEVREYSGQFFGPNAEEVGGVFDITSKDKKSGELRGTFGGRKTE